jgi:MFS family permease
MPEGEKPLPTSSIRRRDRMVVGTAAAVLTLNEGVQLGLAASLPAFPALTAWMRGLVLSGGALGILILSPLAGGGLEQSFRRRNRAIWVGLVGEALAVAGFGWARHFGVWLSLAVVAGLAQGFSVPALLRGLADRLSMSRRARGVTDANTLSVFGLLGVPLVLAALLAETGRRGTFLCLAVLLMLAPLTYGAGRARSDNGGTSPRVPTRRPWTLLGLAATVTLVVGMLQNVVPAEASARLGWSPAANSLYFFGLGLVVAFCQWGVARRPSRPPLWLVSGALLVLGGGLAIMAEGTRFSWWPWPLLAVASLAGIPLGAVFWESGQYASDGGTIGWLESALAAGALMGTVGSGAMWSWWGPGAPWLYAAVAAGSFGLGMVVPVSRPPSVEKQVRDGG